MWCFSTSTNQVAGSSRIYRRTTTQDRILLIMFLVVLSTCASLSHAKVTKKSGKDLSAALGDPSKSELTTKQSTILSKKLRYPATKVKTTNAHQRAIIAIEIVDPNDNSTSDDGKKRNGKRTIDSSLGYGYQPSNYFPVSHKPPRYEVYKYSQRDIPPYHGPKNLFTGESSHIEIQKSIRYDLGSTNPELVQHHPKSISNYRQSHHQSPSSSHLNEYYTPGTILYSSLDQHGNIGGLSQQVPTHPSNHHAGAMVPVIILRVFSNQLTRPGSLHPNLPQSHPYAGLNDIDLQSLLNRYVTQHSDSAAYRQQYQQSPQSYYQQYYQQQHHHQSQLPTQENYPDNLHTKVIFHNRHHSSTRKYPEMIQSPGLTQYHTKPKEIRVHVPENVFSSIQVQEHNVMPQQQHHVQEQVEEEHPSGQAGGYYYYPSQEGQAGQQQEYYQQEEQDAPQQHQHYHQEVQQETLDTVDHSGQEQPQQYQYVQQEEPQQQYETTQEHAHQNIGPTDAEKVYNYHAHGQLGAQKSTRESKKKRKASRVPNRPLVLSPKELEKDLNA